MGPRERPRGVRGAAPSKYLARTCAPRGSGVGRWGPASGRVGFGAQPRLSKTQKFQGELARRAVQVPSPDTSA